MYAAFNRRNFDEAAEFAHEEVELYPGLEGPDTAMRYRGRDEFKQFLETISDVWDAQTVEPLQIVEGPDDQVLVVERWLRRVRQGIEFDIELTDVYTFRDGLIVRIDGYTDKAKALEATGLAE
jgi:ketosteroid isomerase-like protein